MTKYTKRYPMNYLLIVNDPPYYVERRSDGLRLAKSLPKDEVNIFAMFLIGDPVSWGVSGQTTTNRYYLTGDRS